MKQHWRAIRFFGCWVGSGIVWGIIAMLLNLAPVVSALAGTIVGALVVTAQLLFGWGPVDETHGHGK